MAKVMVTESYLEAVGNALRVKLGVQRSFSKLCGSCFFELPGMPDNRQQCFCAMQEPD